MHNIPDPTEVFIVKKLLEGCRRSRRSRDTRAPITENILLKIVKVLRVICYSDYEGTLFKALFTLAYYAFCDEN